MAEMYNNIWKQKFKFSILCHLLRNWLIALHDKSNDIPSFLLDINFKKYTKN